MNSDKIYQEAIEEETKKKEPEKTFLIGEPVPWSEIIEEDNKREWVWENYIAKGHITLLSALWKAGKSTFLRCLFLAMAEEEEFAGQQTIKSKVLVLSEEAKGEWSDKRENLDEDLIKDILIWARPVRIKPNLKQWIETINEAAQRCLDQKIDMVVIDTLSTFWPIDNENDSAQVLKALVPLYAFTENNIAVLLIHHFRKGGGDQAQASRGSGALPGFVDNIIEFTRTADGTIYDRELKTYGRFDEVTPTVRIQLDSSTGKYKTLGTPEEVSKKARLNRIISFFEENPNTLLSAKDIHTFWITRIGAISDKSVRNYIKQLVFEKILSAVESRLSGKKLTPFYALTGNYVEQRKIWDPLGVVTFPVFSSTAENESESLSAVEGEIVPPAEERKGTSPIEKMPEMDPKI